MLQINHLNLEQKIGESRRGQNVNSQIKFKTTMLKSSSYDYSDAYIFVKGTITVNNTGTDAVPNKRNKKGNIRKLHTIY